MALKNMDRGEFLTKSGNALLALGGLSLLSKGLLNVALAAPDSNNENTLLVVFLRGACDGLNFVAPISGADRSIYESERPNIHLNVGGDNGLIALDDKFGIHPKATSFARLFQEKKMAIVHAVGLPSNSRSHFDAQNYMELGTPDKKTTATGWLTRFLHEQADPAGNLPAIASSSLLPTSLLDFEAAISVADIRRLDLAGRPNFRDKQQETIEALYAQGNTWLHKRGKEALSSLKILQSATTKINAGTTNYPKSDIANHLATLADLLKLRLGVRAATIDMGGWDTHKFQGVGLDGVFAKQVEMLTEGLNAFLQDLENSPVAGKVTVVVMTEFGRRLRENANRGTDHGHGSVFFALGAGIQGGKVYGKWPGLATEHLYERADLAVSTDYRDPLTEILKKRFGVKKIDRIFPNYKLQQALKIV